MKLYHKQFLDLEPEFTDLDTSAVAILPFPYEGGISCGAGTAGAPDAVIDASYYVELYDEVLDTEPYKIGISTLTPPAIPSTPERMIQSIQDAAKAILERDKFPVVIGGDHSITGGYYRALREKHGAVSVIQLDAHADLRDSYQGSRLSHASVMSRIREETEHTLQIGIRSMSAEEADRIRTEKIQLCTMDAFRKGAFDLRTAVEALPDPVFITLDVDVLDWSVVRTTGTPEPGGMTWDEILALLATIFSNKKVVGFDVVELSCREDDPNSPFAVAKLIHKMIALKFFP
ncbi:MAG TPA: agmatinase [bacterium]|nr:agmatinase [bacterium]